MLPDGHVLFTIAAAGLGLNDAHIALLDPATLSPALTPPSCTECRHISFCKPGSAAAAPLEIRLEATTRPSSREGGRLPG